MNLMKNESNKDKDGPHDAEERYITKHVNQNDILEFKPAVLEVLETPPSRTRRILTWLICIFVVIVLAWSYFGRLDVVIVAMGQTLPIGHVKTIQSDREARVQAIYVREGSFVSKGDMLLELKADDIKTNLELIKIELKQAKKDFVLNSALLLSHSLDNLNQSPLLNEEDKADLRPLLSKTLHQVEAASDRLDAQILASQENVKAEKIEMQRIKELLPLTREDFKSRNKLYEKKILSKADFRTIKKELIQLEAELERKSHNILMSVQRLQALKAQKNELTANFLLETQHKQKQAKKMIEKLERQLMGEIEKESARKIMAPADGYIYNMNVKDANSVVTVGQNLMTLIPKTTKFEVEALIENKDIGFIHVGQEVRIKTEAFPFTKYGVLTGHVKSINFHPVQQENGTYNFRIMVSLDKQFYEINNKKIPLNSGLNAIVEIKTGKRRIISYFLGRTLKYKDEMLRER